MTFSNTSRNSALSTAFISFLILQFYVSVLWLRIYVGKQIDDGNQPIYYLY